MQEKNSYQILGVDPEAPQSEITAKFREQAKKLHPDANKNDPTKEESLKNLSAAYSNISTPNKRRAHDSQNPEIFFGDPYFSPMFSPKNEYKREFEESCFYAVSNINKWLETANINTTTENLAGIICEASGAKDKSEEYEVCLQSLLKYNNTLKQILLAKDQPEIRDNLIVWCVKFIRLKRAFFELKRLHGLMSRARQALPEAKEVLAETSDRAAINHALLEKINALVDLLITKDEMSPDAPDYYLIYSAVIDLNIWMRSTGKNLSSLNVEYVNKYLDEAKTMMHNLKEMFRKQDVHILQ